MEMADFGKDPSVSAGDEVNQHPETFVEIYLGGKQNSPLPEVMDTDSRSLR